MRTRNEVNAAPWACLFYGAGLRLREALRLRVKDVDFDAEQIAVRSGKGNKDRGTMRPASLHRPLQRPLRSVKRAVEAAGIAKPAICHTLRHSSATHLLKTEPTSVACRRCSATSS